MARRPPPPFASCPPLETLSQISLKTKHPPINYRLTEQGPRRETLRAFLACGVPDDLDLRAFGNVDHLFEVQANASIACQVLRAMACDTQQHLASLGRSLPLRTEVASNLVAVGAAMVTSSFALHLRDAAWSQGPALILLRTGLELAAKGGWVAVGSGDEPTRMRDGPTLPTPEARQAAEVGARNAIRVVRDRCLAPRWPEADDPERVYRWLCGHTHGDYAVITAPVSREHVYCAAAYVAWFAAAMAEVIVGQAGIARAPTLPAGRPW